MKPRWIEVDHLMQRGYAYRLTQPAGQNFHPDLTPKRMLELGVFGGRCMTDCATELPADWFQNAELCPQRHEPERNYFGVNASQPLSIGRANG